MAGRTVNIKTSAARNTCSTLAHIRVTTTSSLLARLDRLECALGLYLLERERLLARLRERGVKIGIATCVQKAVWDSARIFPPAPSAPYRLTDRQHHLRSLFSV